jgi:hypothetical protein
VRSGQSRYPVLWHGASLWHFWVVARLPRPRQLSGFGGGRWGRWYNFSMVHIMKLWAWYFLVSQVRRKDALTLYRAQKLRTARTEICLSFYASC